MSSYRETVIQPPQIDHLHEIHVKPSKGFDSWKITTRPLEVK